MSPSITVIIGCEHSPDFLMATLTALGNTDAEIIVADTAGLQKRAEVVDTASIRGMRVRYLNVPNAHKSSAWNQAAREASGEILAFLDDDCIPMPGWADVIRAPFVRPRTGAVGGPDKVPGHAPVFEQSLDYVLTSFAGTLGMRSGKHVAAYYPRPWNMAVRKDAFLRTGGFDEGYPEASEMPMLRKMQELGYRISYQPHAVVWHYRETDLKRFICRDFRLSMERGMKASQPGLNSVYGTACALLLAAGIAVARKPNSRLPALLGGAYSALLGFSGTQAARQSKKTALSATVPPLMFAHHATHIAGFAAGKAMKVLNKVTNKSQQGEL